MPAAKNLFALPFLALGLLVLPAGPASAGTLGQHVRDCAQTMGFSAIHNPACTTQPRAGTASPARTTVTPQRTP